MSATGERELIWKGAKFDFERVSFVGAGGRVLQREVVRHPGAVCILPLIQSSTSGPSIVLIRNFRLSLGKDLWELPAGTLEPPEPPESCAARELQEETGYVAGRIIPLGTFYTTPGMTDERMHAFLAQDLRRGNQSLQEDERIVCAITPVAEVFAMIDRGDLMDAKSISTIFLALRRGLLPRGSATP